MRDIVIRDAVLADLPRIHEIYNRAILETTATWDEAPWAYEQRLAWWHEHVDDPSTPVLAADAGEGLVGFAYLSWYRPKTGYRFTRENTVYVATEHHGTGVGRALMAELLRRAEALGMRTVIAFIEAENTASLALHRSLGFEVIGTEREVGFKFGRWLSCTVMQKMLPGPGPA